MAIRLNKYGGLESYDPAAELANLFKPKKKGGVSAPVAETAPVPTPKPSLKLTAGRESKIKVFEKEGSKYILQGTDIRELGRQGKATEVAPGVYTPPSEVQARGKKLTEESQKLAEKLQAEGKQQTDFTGKSLSKELPATIGEIWNAAGVGKDKLSLFEVTSLSATAAAEIIDGLQIIYSSRKSLSVTTSETALNDATALIKLNIDSVRNGDMPAYKAREGFRLAQSALYRLEQTNHGLGLLNLRFWIDGGAATEVKIAEAQATLADLEIELNAASMAYYQKQANEQMGL